MFMHLAPGDEFAQVSVQKHFQMYAHRVFTVCVSALSVLWRICQDPALRLCGENWHTGWCGGIDLLRCHLQCWAAVFSMHQPEQWVEPMLVWLVWLGGKWKPLSRFFSLPHPNAKHRREVIWIAKAALAMLIWHWTILIRLYTCWLCFVLSCVLKWASLSTVTLSVGWCSTGWVPWWSGLVILVKKNVTVISHFIPFHRWLGSKWTEKMNMSATQSLKIP